MADVAQKAINANDVKYSSIVSKTGNKTVNTREPSDETPTGTTVAAVEAKYTDRFDDNQYYTA